MRLKTTRLAATHPLIVITNSQSSGEDTAGLSPAQQQYEHVRHELQGELAQPSTNGRLMVAYGSGHNIPFRRPDLVVDAIGELVVVARR